MSTLSAASRAFSIPEILEQILRNLLDYLLPPTNREDARSAKTHANASILLHLLRCSRVNSAWHRCILAGSSHLRRALFLLPDRSSRRSWQWNGDVCSSQQTFYRGLAHSAPILNPVIQMVFPRYHFRYWRSGLGVDGDKDLAYNRHHAYLIVTRRHLAEAQECIDLGFGNNILHMLLAQPPPKELAVTIWEREDVHNPLPSRTMSLRTPRIQSVDGITIGLVLNQLIELFKEHPDLASIKLTTI